MSNKTSQLIENKKAESYINVLKSENGALNNEIKRLNEIVLKLKTQISSIDKEKQDIIEDAKKKEEDLEQIKKSLEDANKEMESLKNQYNQSNKQSQDNIDSLKKLNENLKNGKKENEMQLAELQKKITVLELELKTREKDKNDNNNNNKDNVETNKKISNGIEEMDFNGNIDYKSKLNKQLERLENELNYVSNEKNNLQIQLEKYSKERNKLINLLNLRNEEINIKLNMQNKMSNDLLYQINENKKIRADLENAKLKFHHLEKKKSNLEDTLILQESKVNELTDSVQKIINLIRNKNNEIKNNKLYINNLEDTLRELNHQFEKIRISKDMEASDEVINLRKQLMFLRDSYQKLIDNINYSKPSPILNSGLKNSRSFLNNYNKIKLTKIRPKNTALPLISKNSAIKNNRSIRLYRPADNLNNSLILNSNRGSKRYINYSNDINYLNNDLYDGIGSTYNNLGSSYDYNYGKNRYNDYYKIDRNYKDYSNSYVYPIKIKDYNNGISINSYGQNNYTKPYTLLEKELKINKTNLPQNSDLEQLSSLRTMLNKLVENVSN